MSEGVSPARVRRPAMLRLAVMLLVGWLGAAAAWSESALAADAAAKPDSTVGPRGSESAAPRSIAVEVTEVTPNALSKARAVSEALAKGLPPEAAGDRPSAVDNSATIYFPPTDGQQYGDCTCWSSVYYYNTYTQARDEGLDASGGDPDAVCSHRFMFALINQGASGAEGTEYVMTRLTEVGSANASFHPLDAEIHTWPTEEAWVQALRNRMGTPHKIRADTAAGLEAIKQHLANGNCIVTRGVMSENFGSYPSNSVVGIDNRVWYWKNALWYRHSLCVVGYDDNRSYVDHRDGQTHHGAFLIANSEGADWGWYNTAGERGFFWTAYSMFLEGKFGWYDDSWPWTDPCYDNGPNPEMYYNDDRPRYRPRLFAVAGINHSKRNMLRFTGGISAAEPFDFLGPEAIKQTAEGEIAISDSRRVAVDLSDGANLLVPGVPTRVFVRLKVKSTAGSSATITSADFCYDPEGDGTYMVFSSADPVVTVAPGQTGFATVQIAAPSTVYVDDDNAGDPAQDGTLEHPFGTIQAGIDAATPPAVVKVLPGLYVEHVTPVSNVWIVGSGAGQTTVRTPDVGPAVWFADVTSGLLEGITFDDNPGSVQVRCHRSHVVIRDCVCTGAGNGVGIDFTGAVTLRNCLIAGNTGCGIWGGGTARIEVVNCTIADNATAGAYLTDRNNVSLLNTIFWGNGDDLSVSARTTIVAGHCDVGDGDFAGSNGNMSQDPLFVSGPLHGYLLSQTAGGQASDSPCVDAGSGTAVALALEEGTTRTDLAPDSGIVDMGYHAPSTYAFGITDVYWDQTSTSVVLTFDSLGGVEYAVETAEASAYADDLTWADLTTLTATGEAATVTDNLAVNPLAQPFRFYRVRRADTSELSRQTVGVFELPLTVVPVLKFISTPLIPDPDHASIREVFGEGAARQVPCTGFQVSSLNAASGGVSRMRWDAAGNAMVVAGAEFDLGVCTGYEVVMVGSLAYRLRLTGYVPEESVWMPLSKTGAQALRWTGYSTPRPILLSDLGLDGAVRPWNALNRVRLLFPGSTAWANFSFNGSAWLPYDPIIECGMGIVFVRGGPSDPSDVLELPKWYLRPPNDW